MSQLTTLQSALTLSDVAFLLQVKPSTLSYVLYVRDENSRYSTFTIPKRNGGERTIRAPAPELKLIQRRLSDVLQNCMNEINVRNGFDDESKHPDRLAHGFKRKRSIMTNARRHRARSFVFNTDLADFFGSINFGRVRGFFLKNKYFRLAPRVATVLAQIACHENSLPQGSPCSPVISNLIAHLLDIRLAHLAKKCGCTYSRYADDLTFSSNHQEFPAAIAHRIAPGSHTWVVGATLAKVLRRHGFCVADGKTRMQYWKSRQDVTGLVVNRKVNTPQAYRRSTRAMVHSLLTQGEFFVVGPEGRIKGTKSQLKGMLAFIHQVDKFNVDIQRTQPMKGVRPKRGFAFRDFILFDIFTSKYPTIVCEGKTDYIYLTHAIRSLAGSFSQLVRADDRGALQLAVSMFRYGDKLAGEELELGDGGTSSLAKFLSQYREATEKKFKASGGEQPIILIVDGDDDGTKFFDNVRTRSGKAAIKSDMFLHVLSNLYIVQVPRLEGKSTTIEDLFDEDTLQTKVDGKSFDRNNKSNLGSGYGKTIFAHRVVHANAANINFSRFSLLLERVVAVLAEHKSRHQARADFVGHIAGTSSIPAEAV